MKAVFIRHKLPSKDDFIKAELYDKRRIAIHFQDKKSFNPEDYDFGQEAINRYVDYCKNGAIVGASYSCNKTKMLVGKLNPGTPIDFVEDGTNIYKVAQLIDAHEVSNQQHPLLFAIQPPLAAVTGWQSAQLYLEALILGNQIPRSVSSLHPAMLEVICYEYLRAKGIIAALLLPIGRTLQNIDIAAINSRGETVMAQITHSKHQKQVDEKFETLVNLSSDLVHAYFFGPKECSRSDAKVTYLAIEEIFDFLDQQTIYHEMITKMLYGC